jgi:hypothetical protein
MDAARRRLAAAGIGEALAPAVVLGVLAFVLAWALLGFVAG